MFWIRENKKQNKGGWRDRESHSKRSRVILFGKKGKTKLLGQRKCWSVIVFTYTWGTEQHQNTVIWRVFQLSWGGQMSVLIRLCVWRCSVVNYIYIYIYLLLVLTASISFYLLLIFLLTSAFSRQTKTHSGEEWPLLSLTTQNILGGQNEKNTR